MRQLPGVWSILWLAFILTDLGSTGPELQTKVCQNHQAPHSSGCCGLSAPAPAPEAALKGDPLPHGHPGWQGQVPLDTLQLRTLKICFWPGCPVLSLAWALFWHEPKQTGIWIVSQLAGALLIGKLHPAFLTGRQDCGSDRVASVTLLLLVFALRCINISPVPRPAVL